MSEPIDNTTNPPELGPAAQDQPPVEAVPVYVTGPGPRPGAQAGAAPAVEAAPFSDDELRQAALRPDILAAHVLGGADRVARSLADGRGVLILTALLAAVSLLATVPYGAVAPEAAFWKIAALFAGSLLICFPCLHVFLQFLGFRISLGRNLALSLMITATAALFSLGFFPIIWFIDATTRAAADSAVTPVDLSRVLLGVALLMGLVQMLRCLAKGAAGPDRGALSFLILLWIVLLVFITWRMAGVLGLRG